MRIFKVQYYSEFRENIEEYKKDDRIYINDKYKALCLMDGVFILWSKEEKHFTGITYHPSVQHNFKYFPLRYHTIHRLKRIVRLKKTKLGQKILDSENNKYYTL